MQIRFGAKWAPIARLWKPAAQSPEEFLRDFNGAFKENRVIRQILAETSDEIVLAARQEMGSDEKNHTNEIVFRIDRDPSRLPTHLKQCSRYTRIFSFQHDALTDKEDTATLQFWLAEDLLWLSDELRAFDRTQQRQGESSAGQGGLAQVAGMNGLKEMLSDEVIGPLQRPEEYEAYGLSIPNGILMYGPPGCGKTYMAERLAEELNLPFIKLDGADVASIYIHETVKKIGELFDEAQKKAPCLLFIDEVEAFLPDRTGLSGDSSYKSEEVTELLKRMNKLREKGIVLIAATNRPELIDPAALRSGRMDKHIYVPPPDLAAREASLRFHMRHRRRIGGVDYPLVAGKTEGYSQSDIELLTDEAARIARKQGVPIGTDSFLAALKRVPPSVPAKMEQEYRSILTRGVDSNRIEADRFRMGFHVRD